MRRIIISTGSVNVYGYRLISDGCDLGLFEHNPVLLYMHERGLIIGKWRDIKIENGHITAEPVFAKTDKAKECQQLYEDEMLNMASVWAEPIEWSEDAALMLPGQTGPTVTKWILKEASLVDVAGNKDCIKLVHNDGSEFKLSDFQKPIFNNNSNMKKIALFFKLSDSASEDAVMAEVQKLADTNGDLAKKLADKATEATNLAAENAGLKKQIEDGRKAEFQKLLDNPAKKLTDSQKATYLKLFAKDAESATEAVKALPDYKKLSDVPDVDADGNDDYKGETWESLDKKGRLADVKEKQPELYKKLFKVKFGAEPK